MPTLLCWSMHIFGKGQKKSANRGVRLDQHSKTAEHGN